MEIFRLFGSVFLKDEEAQKKLDEVDKKAGGVGEKLGQMSGTAAKWGAALYAATATAATGLFKMAESAAGAAAEIDDISKRTNMSAASLQEWKYVAEQSGISLETIEGSAKKLTKAMGEYADGNKATIAAFKELGVTATDSNGKLRTTNDVFPEIIASLADMTDITKRDVLAMQIFGKSAMDMGPMLNEASDGIEAMKIRANDLGLVMSDESIQAGAKFDDMLAETKSTLSAVTAQIGISLIPMCQKALEWVMTNMPTIRDVMTDGFNLVAGAVQWVIDNSNWLIPVLGGLAGAFALMKVVAIINGLMAAYEAVVAAVTVVQTILNAVMLANPFGLIVLAIAALVAIGVVLYKNWDTIKEKMTAAFQYIWDFMEPIVTSIRNAFKGLVNGVISGLNFMVRALNKLKFNVPDWVPLIGGSTFGFNIPEIPSFSIGTRYLPEDMLIQAHEGEMIVPKSENPYANSGGSVLPDGNGANELNVYVILDSKEVAKATFPHLNRMQGQDIKIQVRGSVG